MLCPSANRISTDKDIKRQRVVDMRNRLFKGLPMAGIAVLHKRKDNHAPRLEHPKRIAQIHIRLLMQQVRKHREEANEVGLLVLLRNSEACHRLEAPVWRAHLTSCIGKQFG